MLLTSFNKDHVVRIVGILWNVLRGVPNQNKHVVVWVGIFLCRRVDFLASSQSETSSQETQDSSLGLEPYRYEPLQRQYFYLHIWTTANQNETVSRLVCVTDHNRLINPYHVRTFTRSHISRWRYKRGKLFTVSNGLRICDVCTSWPVRGVDVFPLVEADVTGRMLGYGFLGDLEMVEESFFDGCAIGCIFLHLYTINLHPVKRSVFPSTDATIFTHQIIQRTTPLRTYFSWR